MKTKDFFFELAPEFVAQYPAEKRGDSRLLVVDRAAGTISHHLFAELPDLLDPDTLVVVNNSRVRRARLFGEAAGSGGRVEFLLLKELAEGVWQVKCSKMKKQRKGKTFMFPENNSAVIIDERDDIRILKFQNPPDEKYLEQYGHIPLPPYIKREDADMDGERYQTVYSRAAGSVAAPTAGLHFSQGILRQIKGRGIPIVPVTLHVGLGTFTPIRCDTIEDHRMHSEEYEVPAASARLINGAIASKKRILAVGTTSVRTLESAFDGEKVRQGRFSTDLFIYPGYTFKVVAGLLTNFHTPGSSLLVLVSAFAGRELIFRAYEEAKKRKYRFFSYGDAMLIL